MDIKQIRQRIMSEAYDLADRGDHEGYNAIKVMCSDVLELIGKQWVGLTDDECIESLPVMPYEYEFDVQALLEYTKNVEAKLREKNHG